MPRSLRCRQRDIGKPGGDVRAVCDSSKRENVLMKKARALTCVALLLAALLVLGCLAHVRDAGAAETITLDFDARLVGALPSGFSCAVTGRGGPASWMVVEDVTAASGGNVFAQTSSDKTSFRSFASMTD